ncbi:hypothetical protein RRG08_013727 [Elysia crispata]|uniref:Uncharacterized protein n=1 Tax=Elysia crispata TaxID=231223 RepID=A0AAE0ZPM6_9GAST|nr:hypothetical protein RRG08_013727 [Elysia crispata]
MWLHDRQRARNSVIAGVMLDVSARAHLCDIPCLWSTATVRSEYPRVFCLVLQQRQVPLLEWVHNGIQPRRSICSLPR